MLFLNVFNKKFTTFPKPSVVGFVRDDYCLSHNMENIYFCNSFIDTISNFYCSYFLIVSIFFNSIFCRFRKSVPFLSFFFTSRLILFRRNSMHLFLLTKQTNTYPKLTTERLALGDTRMTFTDFILMLLLLTLNIFHTSF